MNRDQIKYAAMFTMLLNHIANIFLEPGTFLFEVMVDVGYFTAITMCYFLVEGYGYTRSKEKYGKRLLLFALISEIPFCLAFTEEGTISFVNMNMLFTLFLCFLILYAMEKIPSGTRRILCIPEATACEPVGEDGGKKGPVTVGGGKYQASGMHRGKCCQPAAGMLIRKAIWLAARILNEKNFYGRFSERQCCSLVC